MILWQSHLHYDRVCLIISDAAPYMIKAASGLSDLFLNLIHGTCAVHGVNHVAELMRSSYEDVNNLIAFMKQIFLKAPSRRKAFLDALSIPLPPSPVITRWGTWIQAACYMRNISMTSSRS